MSPFRYICGTVILHYQPNSGWFIHPLFVSARSVLDRAPLVVWHLHPRELMLELFFSSHLSGSCANLSNRYCLVYKPEANSHVIKYSY